MSLTELREPETRAAAAPHPPGGDPTAPTPADATDAWWEKLIVAASVLLGLGVGGLGLYSSFKAQYAKAAQPAATGGWGWSDPWMLPVGLDTSILAFGIVNLLLIKARSPMRWVKWVPRAATAISIYLNWEAAATLPAQAGHAALAATWVVVSEIAAHMYAVHIDAVDGKQRTESIKAGRWFLSPLSTAALYRSMVLHGWTYEETTQRRQEWMVYRQRLASTHASRLRWRFRATPQEMAPFQLARFGLSVYEALSVPLLEEVREQQRKADAAVQRARAQIQIVDADVRLRTAQLQAEVAKIKADGELELARAQAEQATEDAVQQMEAAFHVDQARRQGELELLQEGARAEVADIRAQATERRRQEEITAAKAQAAGNAEVARIHREQQDTERRLQAEADRAAAESAAAADLAEAQRQRRLAAEDKLAEDLRREAAEQRRQVAETERAALEAEAGAQRIREETAASAARQAAAEQALVERRAAIAEREAAAVESAARARLTQADWDAERVKALIQGHGGPEAVTIDMIASHLGCSTGTAHNRKQLALGKLDEPAEKGRHTESTAAA